MSLPPHVEALSTLYVLPGVAHGVPALTDAMLTALDAYLRRAGKDSKRPHVLGFYTDNARVNAITGHARDWTGWNGLTLTRKRWNWQTGCVDSSCSDKVDISLCRVFSDDATMFGLIVHESAHMSGAVDGSPNVLGTASNWERLAVRAWRKQVNVGTAGERDRALALARIIRR